MSLQFSLGPISKTEIQESQNNGKHAFIPIQNQSLQEKPANFHPRVKKNIFFPQHVFRPALAPWSPLSAKVACHLSSPPCWGAQRWLAKTLIGLFKKVFPYHIETTATTQDIILQSLNHPAIPEAWNTLIAWSRRHSNPFFCGSYTILPNSESDLWICQTNDSASVFSFQDLPSPIQTGSIVASCSKPSRSEIGMGLRILLLLNPLESIQSMLAQIIWYWWIQK